MIALDMSLLGVSLASWCMVIFGDVGTNGNKIQRETFCTGMPEYPSIVTRNLKCISREFEGFETLGASLRASHSTLERKQI